MAFEPDELLATAIMSKIPVIVVEGHDDVPIYERLAVSVNKDCEVFASENLVGVEGCSGVIKTVESIRACSGDIAVEDYILGVIDRDVRPYRNECPTDPAILMLELYSIESHFVTTEAVQLIVRKVTGATAALFDEDDAEKVFNIVRNNLNYLYLLALEPLRKACESTYSADYGFRDKLKEILGRGYPNKLLENKAEQLYEFAEAKGISESWEAILEICKGKWVLSTFMEVLRAEIENLPVHCKSTIISQCQYCINETFNKCLYRLKAKYTAPILEELIIQEPDLKRLDYIKSRIVGLKAS